jgi:hypothetical protein
MPGRAMAAAWRRPASSSSVGAARPACAGRLQQPRPPAPPSTGDARAVAARASLRLVQPDESDMAVPYPSPQAEADFHAALADPDLCAEVLSQAQAAGKAGEGVSRVAWVRGAAFVPQPWSPASPRGVPLAWDELAGRDDHVVIQVPPPVTCVCVLFGEGGGGGSPAVSPAVWAGENGDLMYSPSYSPSSLSRSLSHPRPSPSSPSSVTHENPALSQVQVPGARPGRRHLPDDRGGVNE